MRFDRRERQEPIDQLYHHWIVKHQYLNELRVVVDCTTSFWFMLVRYVFQLVRLQATARTLETDRAEHPHEE